MTKKERIAVLESQVAELSRRLAEVEARPAYFPVAAPNIFTYGDATMWKPEITCSPAIYPGTTTSLTGDVSDKTLTAYCASVAL